jgi:DNA-directed RNA polymerase subunit RPC12/RpoP
MLSDMEEEDAGPPATRPDQTPTAPCPQCGFPMVAIRGSRDAVCPNCGFKDSCCY